MPRGLTTAQQAAISARVASVAYFVHLDLAAPANDVRVWTGRGDQIAMNETWRGVGELGIIEGIGGERSLRAGEISLALAGIPGELITPGIVAETRSVRYQGRPLYIYLGIFNPEFGSLIDDPVPVWGGFADVLSFQLGETATVALTGQHYDSHMRRSSGWNMSTVSHNLRFGLAPNTDLFFEPNDRLMGAARPLL